MKSLHALAAAAVVAGGLGLAGSAQAAPIGLGAATAFDDSAATRVAGGCGPGFAPNPWGVCRPFRRYGYGPRFYGPRPVYGPPRFYGPRPYYGPRRFY
jgi:hypothetical protein